MGLILNYYIITSFYMRVTHLCILHCHLLRTVIIILHSSCKHSPFSLVSFFLIIIFISIYSLHANLNYHKHQLQLNLGEWERGSKGIFPCNQLSSTLHLERAEGMTMLAVGPHPWVFIGGLLGIWAHICFFLWIFI